MKIKILFVGSFGPWSLASVYLREFKNLGHEIVCFDMTAEYEKTSWFTKNRYINRVVFPYVARIMNKKLLEMVKNYNPELIFILKGQWLFPETLKKIKDNTQALFFILNPDDPFNLNRGASSKFIRNSIPIYDVYFIWSKVLMSRLKNAGARQVEYLPFAYDSKLHYPFTLTDEDKRNYDYDVVFIGNWDEEREMWLSELKGHNLAIWGSDYWVKRCKCRFLKSCWKGKIVIGEEMSRIIQCAKINLNILRLQNKKSHNMRTFEIPACSGFMLHERSVEANEFFKEGKEAEYFDSAIELKDKIRFYLSNDNFRKEIARAGYEKCMKSGYLYADRAKQVLGVYEKLRNKLNYE